MSNFKMVLLYINRSEMFHRFKKIPNILNHATVLPCYRATVLPCYRATTSKRTHRKNIIILLREHLYLIVRCMQWLSLSLEDMTLCMFGNLMKVNSMQDWTIICFHQKWFESLIHIRCPNLMNLSHVSKPVLIARRLKSWKI